MTLTDLPRSSPTTASTASHSAATSADGGCSDSCGQAEFTVSRRVAIGAGVAAGAALMVACGSEASTTTATSAGSGTTLAQVADVPADGSLVVTVNSTPYALAKKPDGTVVVHTAVCTHQRCTVAADGAKLTCPCHKSAFDAITGAVINGPAASPLAEIAVEEKSGAVVVK